MLNAGGEGLGRRVPREAKDMAAAETNVEDLWLDQQERVVLSVTAPLSARPASTL